MKDEKYFTDQGFTVFTPTLDADAGDLIGLVQDGYCFDGAHHKDWFFEQIAALLGIPLIDKPEKGISP